MVEKIDKVEEVAEKPTNGNGDGNGHDIEHLEKTPINIKDLDEDRVIGSEITREIEKSIY